MRMLELSKLKSTSVKRSWSQIHPGAKEKTPFRQRVPSVGETKGRSPPTSSWQPNPWREKKAGGIPTPAEFMLLNTYKSFKIQTKSRPKCKGYWSWDFIARCKSIFSKTYSRSPVPHLKYFMCAEWICWLPVAFINYEVQVA